MQRWFLPIDEASKDKKGQIGDVMSESEQRNGEPREWEFVVRAPDVRSGEVVCVTGDTSVLGTWNPELVVPLARRGVTDVWSGTLTLPSTCDVSYRYCICMISEDPKVVMVRRWEVNLTPRLIEKYVVSTHEEQVFGDYGVNSKVAAGWLIAESLIQLKFSNNPFKLKNSLSQKLIQIKVTPVDLTLQSEFICADESSTDNTNDNADPPSNVSVEVSTLDDENFTLKPQNQFGRIYNASDFVHFNILTPNMDNLAYQVDLFSQMSRGGPGEPPTYLGYTYVLPSMFAQSQGKLELPITCSMKHRPLGTVKIDYLIVKPMANFSFDMKVSYSKYWNSTWTGLDVGHRGLGSSFKTRGSSIRENTIASLKTAAASGADLLEFDVQLSRDLVPIIYHDFHVAISLKPKKQVEYSEMLELPLKDLTYEQLQKLKVYHVVEGRDKEPRFFDEDLEEHQPFPTLAQVFAAIDLHVGFNVEVKWTMEKNDGTFELNNPFEINSYVDKILEVVLSHAGERRIVFSCFHPDICTMLRYKQNRYPVMFLTQGVTSRYPGYLDPRCASIPAAVHFCMSCDLLGVVVHTEDLLRDPTQVKLARDAGLVIFCWGDDNNDKDTIKLLKDLGLNAIIYDKLDQYSTKAIKESIFLVESRESQNQLLGELAGAKSGDGSPAQASAGVALHTTTGVVLHNANIATPRTDTAGAGVASHDDNNGTDAHKPAGDSLLKQTSPGRRKREHDKAKTHKELAKKPGMDLFKTLSPSHQAGFGENGAD